MITGKYFGPYTMTKHALEAHTESLAAELEPHGVLVSIVQPGGIVSEIGEKSDAATRARLGRAPEPFQEEARVLLESLDQDDAFDENRQPVEAKEHDDDEPDLDSGDESEDNGRLYGRLQHRQCNLTHHRAPAAAKYIASFLHFLWQILQTSQQNYHYRRYHRPRID